MTANSSLTADTYISPAVRRVAGPSGSRIFAWEREPICACRREPLGSVHVASNAGHGRGSPIVRRRTDPADP